MNHFDDFQTMINEFANDSNDTQNMTFAVDIEALAPAGSFEELKKVAQFAWDELNLTKPISFYYNESGFEYQPGDHTIGVPIKTRTGYLLINGTIHEMVHAMQHEKGKLDARLLNPDEKAAIANKYSNAIFMSGSHTTWISPSGRKRTYIEFHLRDKYGSYGWRNNQMAWVYETTGKGTSEAMDGEAVYGDSTPIKDWHWRYKILQPWEGEANQITKQLRQKYVNQYGKLNERLVLTYWRVHNGLYPQLFIGFIDGKTKPLALKNVPAKQLSREDAIHEFGEYEVAYGERMKQVAEGIQYKKDYEEYFDHTSFSLPNCDRGMYSLKITSEGDNVILIAGTTNGEELARFSIPRARMKSMNNEYIKKIKEIADYQKQPIVMQGWLNALSIERGETHTKNALKFRKLLGDGFTMDEKTARQLYYEMMELELEAMGIVIEKMDFEWFRGVLNEFADRDIDSNTENWKQMNYWPSEEEMEEHQGSYSWSFPNDVHDYIDSIGLKELANENPERYHQIMQSFDNEMKQLQKDYIAYRGIGLDSLDDLEPESDFRKRKTIKFPIHASTSTSSDKGVFFAGSNAKEPNQIPVLYIIKVKKGTRGIDTRYFPDYKEEQELVLHKDTIYNVKSVKEMKMKSWHWDYSKGTGEKIWTWTNGWKVELETNPISESALSEMMYGSVDHERNDIMHLFDLSVIDADANEHVTDAGLQFAGNFERDFVLETVTTASDENANLELVLEKWFMEKESGSLACDTDRQKVWTKEDLCKQVAVDYETAVENGDIDPDEISEEEYLEDEEIQIKEWETCDDRINAVVDEILTIVNTNYENGWKIVNEGVDFKDFQRILREVDVNEACGLVLAQNATIDVPIGGEYMNVNRTFPTQNDPKHLNGVPKNQPKMAPYKSPPKKGMDKRTKLDANVFGKGVL